MGCEEGYLSPSSSLLFPAILKPTFESNFLTLCPLQPPPPPLTLILENLGA